MENLAVTQSGHDLVLTWTNPPRFIDGSTATNLSSVLIRKNGEPLATVGVNAFGQAQSYVMPATPVNGERQTFAVVIQTAQGKLSDVSNSASITPVDVPGSVAGLSGFVDQRRIFLQWQQPKDHPELVEGYLVTRSDIPAQSVTVTDARYEDARYQAGKTWSYQVTAVRRVDDRVVLGVGSEPVMVAGEDKKAPAVPAGIEIVVSDSGGYLTWDPNEETDVAGYRVYRSDRADGGFKPVGEGLIKPNGFLDASYRPGSYYAVQAVDEFGNHSAMSAPFRGP